MPVASRRRVATEHYFIHQRCGGESIAQKKTSSSRNAKVKKCVFTSKSRANPRPFAGFLIEPRSNEVHGAMRPVCWSVNCSMSTAHKLDWAISTGLSAAAPSRAPTACVLRSLVVFDIRIDNGRDGLQPRRNLGVTDSFFGFLVTFVTIGFASVLRRCGTRSR